MQYKQAREIALVVYKKLIPFCERLDIAGSVRRESQNCHDIEFCCTPKTMENKDLFGVVLGRHRSNEFVREVNNLGLIIKGKPVDGRYVQIQLPEGINLDLFIPQETDYYRQVAIRTGSADYSHKVLANSWLKCGWVGTKNGLRKMSECTKKLVSVNATTGAEKTEWICNTEAPTLPPVWKNELEFFNFIGLSWIEPKNRYV